MGARGQGCKGARVHVGKGRRVMRCKVRKWDGERGMDNFVV